MIKHFLLKNHSVRQIFLKNTFWLVSSEIINRLLKFFLIQKAAIILGPSDFGLFYYFTSIIMLFYLFSDLGLSWFFIKYYQNKKKKDLEVAVSTFFYIKITLIVISFLFSLFGFVFIKELNYVSAFFLCLLFVFFKNLKVPFTVLNECEKKVEQFTIINIIEQLFHSILGILLLIYTQSFVYFILSYVISNVLSTLLFFILFRNNFPKIKNFSKHEAKTILSESTPYLMTVIISMLLANTDTIMIKYLRTSEEVGFYQVGFRLVGVITGFGSILSRVSFPIISEIKNKTKQIERAFQKATTLTIIFTVPIAIGGWILADEIILMLFKKAYFPAIVGFKFLLLSMVFSNIVSIVNSFLVGLDHVKIKMKISSFVAFLNILVNIPLIIYYGYTGAIIGSLFCKIIDISFSYFYLNKFQNLIFNLTSIGKILLASTTMGFAVYWLSNQIDNMFISIAFGCLLYLFFLSLFKEEYYMETLQLFKKNILK